MHWLKYKHVLYDTVSMLGIRGNGVALDLWHKSWPHTFLVAFKFICMTKNRNWINEFLGNK